MRIITRYIAARVLRGILLAFLIVTAIIMLVDFVEATRNMGDDGSISLLKIAGLTMLKVPQLIEETIPFVVLFGVMGTLYGLNKRSELVVLRASGLSAWRFLRPAVFVTAFIGFLWSGLFNPLAAKSMERYQDILLASAAGAQTAKALTEGTSEDIWLREGTADRQIVIHGTRPLPSGTALIDVTFYFYDIVRSQAPTNSASSKQASEDDPAELQDTKQGAQKTLFTRRVDAKLAVLKSGYWQLEELTDNISAGAVSGQPAKTLVAQYASIPTQITVGELQNYKSKSSKISFWKLPSEVARNDAAGFSTVSLRLQLHKLLALPLMLMAMTIIAAGVSMQNIRAGGALRLMLAGGVVGFSVYFVNTLMSAFGEAQSLPIPLAAWAVPLFVLLLALAYMTRIEDG
jgi:lipopolysaccharide export system permease protein